MERWLIAFALALGILITLRVLEAVLAHRYFKKDQVQGGLYGLIGSLVEKASTVVMAILAVFAGSLVLELPAPVDKWFSAVVIIAFIIQTAIWANELIVFALRRYQSKHDIREEGDRMTTLRALGFLGKLVLIAVAALLVLDNIPGVKITTLLASLGIGGIAVAIALQNILADLFASLSIVLDKPFVIGDFIVVDVFSGTVEYIGLKSTRIRSLSGEQLIFSNNDLLKSRIRNFKRMAERRVLFSIGVVYQTPHEKIKRIPGMIRETIEAQDNVRFDRAHFQGYADSALNFEIVYYVLSAEYNLYMDIRQTINLELFKKFADADISFAYPTRTVHLQTPAEGTGLEQTPSLTEGAESDRP
ncbi:MAG: mechanosensitive ion channel family protein [Desulfobacteraceae bacterium]|nr:MAG: mechanosensitive ion channel family protein [Desulfobacteraceae bacterium]